MKNSVYFENFRLVFFMTVISLVCPLVQVSMAQGHETTFTETLSDLSTLSGTTSAVTSAVAAIDTKKRTKDLKIYLKTKYKDIGEVSYRTGKMQGGPTVSIEIYGSMKPKKVLYFEDKSERLRAITRAFMEEEAGLLGITNIDEFREFAFQYGIGAEGGITDIYLQRYINNLELEYAVIHITLRDNETVRSVSANLEPAPQDLYEAVAKKTLSEEKIRAIVEEDLRSAGIKDMDTELKKIKMKKLATSLPPYVVWKVQSVWIYTINAFTGEILQKIESWKTLK